MIKDKQGIQPELREALKGIPMPAEADLAGGAELGDVVAKVNALLGKLRAAGLLGEQDA